MEGSFVTGAISVKAVVEGDRKVNTVFIDPSKKSRDFSYILKIAQNKGISVKEVDESFFNSVTQSKTHGGIAANVENRRNALLSDLIKPANPFIIFLDGIEDPYNFGDALRTVYAAGATGVILPQRNWTTATETVVRSSAGASEKISILVSENPSEEISKLRKEGLMHKCAFRGNGCISIFNSDFRIPFVLSIGGALRGISKNILSIADEYVYIPYGNDFRCALSTASACAVLGFEALRQRNE